MEEHKWDPVSTIMIEYVRALRNINEVRVSRAYRSYVCWIFQVIFNNFKIQTQDQAHPTIFLFVWDRDYKWGRVQLLYIGDTEPT